MKYLIERQLKWAERHEVSYEELRHIERKLLEVDPHHVPKYARYYVSAFERPDVLVVSNKKPTQLKLFKWGLMSNKMKNYEEAVKSVTKYRTANARGEEMFEKRLYREAAANRRCIVLIDGFFEYHHHNNKAYPFHIYPRDEESMLLGGIYEEYLNRETGEVIPSVSVITTKASPKMTVLHNNPKLPEPRMPLILDDENLDKWLYDTEEAKKLVKPYPDGKLNFKSVPQLTGKNGVGDTERAVEEVIYPELEETYKKIA
ncbi:SOS response-associated peptidase [Bacteroidota bacterium]